MRAFLRNRGAVIGTVILLLVVLLAGLAPVLFPFSPWDMQGAPFAPPGEEGFLLGSDSLGRDVAAGIAYGAGVSLLVGLVSTAASLLVGVTLGAIAGAAGGMIDDGLMRLTEFFQTIPSFLLAVVLVAIFTPSLQAIVVAIALVSWPPVARVVRAEFLSLRTREFVQAAEVLGRSRLSIILFEMLPNAMSPIIVLASLTVASAILLEASLSFLGLGDPNLMSWGYMIGAGRSVIRLAWWMSVFPGIAIFLTVLALNLVGEGLNDALNPRLSRRAGRGMSLLSVEGLTIALPAGGDRAQAVSDVGFVLEAGELLCIVGESGSGKSMSAAAIMGLLPHGLLASGRIAFEGVDLLGLSAAALRRLRGRRIGMIFQEPMTALNPMMRVGAQVAEVLEVHGEPDRGRVLSLMQQVNLPDPARILRAYPHALSGGQRQRVMIAMALALEPAVLIADEPTTALDVTTQMQILRLIREIQTRRGMGVLFITHDFGVVAEIADRVIVMQHGRIVEHGDAGDILAAPAHPYTRALIAAIPRRHRVQRPPAAGAPVLEMAGVSKVYRRSGGWFRASAGVQAVDRADLVLRRGETLGLVGESGSGKSTLARTILKLVQPSAGVIRYEGTDLRPLSRRAMKPFRRRVQMVFQDPYASLNPRSRVGDIIAAGPIAHGMGRAAALARARELLALVQLDAGAERRFPHEFSGGQRQRIGIARALALEPELLIADEPVSALDVSVQAQILELLEDLRVRLGLTMLFITHDLRVAAQICDRVAVMQKGVIVEQGPTAAIFADPQHAYTQSLLAAIPGRGWAPPL